MQYLFACCTDAGNWRQNNQDALLLKQASFRGKKIVLAAVCDGMGGLRKGEVASGALIRAFAGWFDQELPGILAAGCSQQKIFGSLDRFLTRMNERLRAYGCRHRIQTGTTVTAMLFAEDAYYTVHVGDCRGYEITSCIRRLTRDQTLAQEQVECGILTPEDAEYDVRRNILLQCIGASGKAEPVYRKGEICKNAVYLLCSDGFWHSASEPELQKVLAPEKLKEEAIMEKSLLRLVAQGRGRGEQDNISVLAVRTYE